MVPKVTVLSEDDDARSVASYDSDASFTHSFRGRSSKRARQKRSSKIERGHLKIDGKVPSVIHTLEYIDRRSDIIACRSPIRLLRRQSNSLQ